MNSNDPKVPISDGLQDKLVTKVELASVLDVPTSELERLLGTYFPREDFVFHEEPLWRSTSLLAWFETDLRRGLESWDLESQRLKSRLEVQRQRRIKSLHHVIK